MEKPGQRWTAEHGRLYAEQSGTMRDYLRHEITRTNLEHTLAEFLSRPRRIADIGGGAGGDAIRLAGSGRNHEVVLVEPDAQYIIAAANSEGFSNLHMTIQGDSQSALAKYGRGYFDLVLSHGVLMYLDRPNDELERLSGLLQPGGYLSLLTAGKFGKIERMKSLGRQADLDKLIFTKRYVNEIGAVADAYLPQEIEAMLGRAGFEAVDWFGVNIRNDVDRRPLEGVPVLHRNRVLNTELEDSRDRTLRPRGQMLHYIARKNT